MGVSKSKDSKSPLDPKAVVDFLFVVKTQRNCKVFFDNFFTSCHLLWDLNEKEFKVVAREDNGFYDFVCVIKWKDNKVVYIASNHGQI